MEEWRRQKRKGGRKGGEEGGGKEPPCTPPLRLGVKERKRNIHNTPSTLPRLFPVVWGGGLGWVILSIRKNGGKIFFFETVTKKRTERMEGFVNEVKLE